MNDRKNKYVRGKELTKLPCGKLEHAQKDGLVKLKVQNEIEILQNFISGMSYTMSKSNRNTFIWFPTKLLESKCKT